MTLLAGYDFVLEIGQPLVRDLILRDLNIAGTTLRPPAELGGPVPVDSTLLQLHCITHQTDVDIESLDGAPIIAVRISFQQGSLEGGSAPACPLTGTITVTARVQLVRGPSTLTSATVGLAHADVQVAFSDKSRDRLHTALDQLVSVDVFEGKVSELLAQLVHASGQLAIPGMEFFETPRKTGGVNPLRLTTALLRGHYDPDRSKQALFLFGNILERNAQAGRPDDKTEHAIPAGMSVSTSLSAEVVQTCFLCPVIADGLRDPQSPPIEGCLSAETLLPPGCGTAGPFAIQALTLPGVTDTSIVAIQTMFLPGLILLTLEFKGNLPCVEFHGFAPVAIRPPSPLTGNQWTLEPLQPRIQLYLKWYCVLVGFALSVTLLYLQGELPGFIRRLLAAKFQSGNQDTFGVFTPDVTTISTEGVTLSKNIPVVLPAPQTPSVRLSVDDRVVRAQVLTELDGLLCDMSVVEQLEWHAVTFTLQTRLYGRPIAVKWSIRDANDVAIPLEGTSGAVRLVAEASYETFTGTTFVDQDVDVAWRVTSEGQQLMLFNDPKDGTYNVRVVAAISNCPDTLDSALSDTVRITGHVRHERSGRLQDCLKEWMGRYSPKDDPRPPDFIPVSPVLDGIRMGRAILTLATAHDAGPGRASADLVLAAELELGRVSRGGGGG